MALLVCLLGPTAVGKTNLALKLAPLINAEIISCDSMQVYKGIDIATSKPSIKEREIVKHYMIDVVSPEEEYCVADYCRSALRAIEGIVNRNKTPLIVGGSGLYFKALIDGIFVGPSKNAQLRESLYREAKEKGNRFLYEKLRTIDYETAQRLHPNDLRRIVRALEVYYLAGVPISMLQKNRGGLISQFDIIIYGLIRERNSLYQRINERVEKMFKAGIIEEINKLRNLKITPSVQQCLGYKEIISYLEGRLSLEETKELLKKNTRNFAKRQLIWFRKDKRIKWIDLDKYSDLDNLAKELANEISKFSNLLFYGKVNFSNNPF